MFIIWREILNNKIENFQKNYQIILDFYGAYIFGKFGGIYFIEGNSIYQIGQIVLIYIAIILIYNKHNKIIV